MVGHVVVQLLTGSEDERVARERARRRRTARKEQKALKREARRRPAAQLAAVPAQAPSRHLVDGVAEPVR